MNTTLNKVLEELPKQQAKLITDYAKNNTLSYFPADFIDELRQSQQEQSQQELGLSLLSLASSFAVAPVSNFYVGAVAFDSIGNAYLGANFEFSNTYIGQTIHAEQSAITNDWAHGAVDLSLLVINYSPCGHCRQFINEVNLANNFKIKLPNNNAEKLSYFLPNSFGPGDLNINERILGKHSNRDDIDKNDILTMAKQAYKNSHAPYSNSKSGIALQYNDGEIYTGYYAENAAFNPSLPPLQMALNVRRLQGKDWKKIKQAVMIEDPVSLSQKESTISLLKTFCDVELQYMGLQHIELKHQENI